MTSPFHEAPGIHKYGDRVYEWRSLLNTPCYGFNGPNACYSSTCSHNPVDNKLEKQLTKQKLSTASNISLKVHHNGRKLSGVEHATDHNGSKLAMASHLTVQMNVYNNYNAYNEFEHEIDGEGIYVDGITSESSQWYNGSSSNEINQFSESMGYYTHSENAHFTMNHQSESNFEFKSNHENGVKKYAFNPLSKPFHPMRKNSISSVSSSDGSDADSLGTSISNSIVSSAESSKEFVCILCPEKFTTFDELQNHIKNKVQLPYACVICGMSYEHKYLLQRHFKNHRGLKSFSCRCCHKKFRSLNQLRKHFELCRYKLYIFI